MPVRRKVALKLIKAGMDSRSVMARFEAERQDGNEEPVLPLGCWLGPCTKPRIPTRRRLTTNESPRSTAPEKADLTRS